MGIIEGRLRAWKSRMLNHSERPAIRSGMRFVQTAFGIRWGMGAKAPETIKHL